MRKDRKILKEYKERLEQLQYCIDVGLEGDYEQQRDKLIDEWVKLGNDPSLLLKVVKKDDVISYSPGYLKSFMKKALLQVMDDPTTWVYHNGYQVNTRYNFIRQFHEGEYIMLQEGRTVNGVRRTDFIMEALENNKHKVDYKVPSCGYGRIRHIASRGEFKGNLDKKLFDSPLNLMRVPEGDTIVAMRTKGQRVEVHYYNSYESLHQHKDLKKYTLSYVRQAVRNERKLGDWYLAKIDNAFDISIIEQRAEESRELMEELGWLL